MGSLFFVSVSTSDIFRWLDSGCSGSYLCNRQAEGTGLDGEDKSNY